MSRLRNRIRPGDGDRRHGTRNGYVNHGCRCAECRAANTAYCIQRRAVRMASNLPVLHGTRNGYINYGCRCLACTTAKARAAAEHRLAGAR